MAEGIRSGARKFCDFLASHSWSASILLFAIALAVRLAIIFHFRFYLDLSRFELERTAISLATRGVYGNPYAVPTGPTGHVAPGYTLILAGLFRLFGTGVPGEILKEVLAATVTSLEWALVPWVAASLGLEMRAGLLAGLAAALCALWPKLEVQGDWEAPYVAIFLMLVAGLSARLWIRRNFTARSSILYGCSWGIGLLFAPILLLLFPAVVFAGLFFGHREWRSYAKFTALQIFVTALWVTPWVLRNYYALGSPVLTRTNIGIELRLSNNDLAAPDMDTNYARGLFVRYHPLQNAKEALKIRRMGEIAYGKQLTGVAEQWIRSHPVRFVELCRGRARDFWFYFDHKDPISAAKTLFIIGINTLGFAGLALLLRRRCIAGVVVALVALIYPLPYYVVQTTLRYSYPIEWMMLLLSATFLFYLFELRSPPRKVNAISNERRP